MFSRELRSNFACSTSTMKMQGRRSAGPGWPVLGRKRCGVVQRNGAQGTAERYAIMLALGRHDAEYT